MFDTEWALDTDKPSTPERRVLPEHLDEMEPGVELGRLLALVDRSKLNGHELVILLQARARHVAHLQAELYADMYELAHTPPGTAASPPERLDTFDEFASDEIAAALTLSPRAADYQLSLGCELSRLPGVWEALRRGSIDLPRARVFCRETEHLAADEARDVADSLLGRAGEKTTGRLAAALRRRCLERYPDAARRRHWQAVKERGVEHYRNPDGTADLCARQLPLDRVAAIFSRINRLARQLKGQDDRNLDQIRADILMDLLQGKTAYGATTKGGVEIRVDLPTLLHLDDRAGEIPGWGPIISDVARQVVHEQIDSPWRFVVTDPDAGQPLSTLSTRRRPTTAQRRYIQARNPRCIFPGCSTPATHTHSDHTLDHARGGPTVIANLGPLCARHHLRTKHRAGWHLQQPESGHFSWTSPRSHQYDIRPPPL